jgi:hypothetical protein
VSFLRAFVEIQVGATGKILGRYRFVGLPHRVQSEACCSLVVEPAAQYVIAFVSVYQEFADGAGGSTICGWALG